MKRKINEKKNKGNGNIIEYIKKDPTNLIVPIISLLILIVSSFTIGILLGIILFVIINCVFFLPQYLKNKKGIKKSTSKNKKKKKKIGLLILLCLFIIFVILIIGFFIMIMMKAPNFDPEKLYTSDPSIVLDVNGKEVAKLGTEQRTTITYDEVSESLIDAIVATEDSRFFEHKGVDWARFIKASTYQLMGKSEAGGASTLTMQLSKNTYTSTKAEGIEGILRKFTDVYISLFKIEKKYTKEQIFEFYMNSQYLGNSSYGVEQAALTYFGKSAKDLNISESALIAGLFQAPATYNVYDTSEAESNGRTRAEARRKNVLRLMLRHGYINKDEYKAALKLTVDKIVIDRKSSNTSISGVSKYQSFIDYLVKEIEKDTGYNPYTTTMTIYSTMDVNIQDHVTKIMNGDTYNWHDDTVKAGIAITNVKTGAITALGGGRNIDAIGTLNYATDTNFQIGSTAKPLYDYGPAIEYNNWSTYQPVPDEPITYSNGTKINNWNGTYEGFETARVALRGSRNIPALKTFKQNDKAKVIEFVTKLGLSPEIYSCDKGYYLDNKKCINEKDTTKIKDANVATTLHEAHAIGGYNGESPLTLTAAYAAFANKGTYIEPYSYTKVIIEKTDKETIKEIKNNKAMSEETAYMISDMLVTTAPFALNPYANVNGIKFAAKTGTTNFDQKTVRAKGLPADAVNDLWTVGFNTEYAVGVWYGYDPSNSRHHNKVSSGQHTRLFQAVARKVFTNGAGFTKPNGVVSVTVESECAEAMLPSEFTPGNLKQTELFKKGFEPSKVSERFAKLTNATNVTTSVNNDEITIKWNKVSVPKIDTRDYLTKMYSKIFETGFINSFVNNRLGYIKNSMGDFGYNVYLKDPDGTLKLLGFTTNNSYTYKPELNGEYIFVVKTSYSKFTSNMSSGVTTNASISSIKEEEPEILVPDVDDTGDNTDENTDNNPDENTDIQ